MFGETNTSFLSGSTALSFIAYGLFSAFVSGPELLHREALKARWPEQCVELVHQELKDKQPSRDTMPQIDLGGLLDGVFGRGTSGAFGDVINLVQKVIDLSNEHTNSLARANQARLNRKIEAAGSRCNCAVSMLSEQRIPLGLYASSGRMITPSLFKNLSSSLHTSLRSMQCKQGE